MNQDRVNIPVKDKERRNLTLDIAKGFLIIFMVVGHSGAPAWLLNSIYSFHMPCFFIISGILFSNYYLDKPSLFIRKRMRSLWWPFVLWTFIFLCLHNLFYEFGIYSESINIKQFTKKLIASLFLLNTEQLLGGFWFLGSLLIANIVSLFYYKFIGMSKKKIIMGIIFFLLSSEILTVLNFKYYHLDTVNLLACGYFLIGTLIRSINLNKFINKKILITLAIVIIGLYSFQGKIEMGNLNPYNLIPYFLTSCLISWAFIMLLENFEYKTLGKYIAYIGRKTLDILIFHFLAFRLISLIKIYIYDLDIDYLSQFPVIEENNSFFWIVYVTLGLILCITFSLIKDSFKTSTLLLKKRKNQRLSA